MTRAPLQQALDALKFAYNACDSDWVMDEKIDPAIAALQAAIDAPEPEPVAYSRARGLHWHPGKGINDVQLYTRPAVPLTDEQIENIIDDDSLDTIHAVARAVEAAHGIKPSPALDHKPDWSAA